MSVWVSVRGCDPSEGLHGQMGCCIALPCAGHEVVLPSQAKCMLSVPLPLCSYNLQATKTYEEEEEEEAEAIHTDTKRKRE